MVLATFAETKVARLPGRTPATQEITVIREFGKKGATPSPTNALQLENLKLYFRQSFYCCKVETINTG